MDLSSIINMLYELHFVENSEYFNYRLLNVFITLKIISPVSRNMPSICLLLSDKNWGKHC